MHSYECSQEEVLHWIEQVDAAGLMAPLGQLDQLIESAPNADHPLNHYLQGLRDGRFVFEVMKVRLPDA